MSNEILKFCETDSGTNLLTQAEYNADAQRIIGNQPGIARDKLVNKAIRQSAFISNAFAEYLIQQTGGSVLDDADTATLLAKITSTFATGIPVGGLLKMPTEAVPSGFFKCNGAAVSRTTYSSLFDVLVTDPGFSLEEFTVTIASPCLVTSTGHGFKGGERLRLSTTGTLPTGLDTTTDYFVYYNDANSFYLQTFSNIIAGTFVNTSDSQSGTHSYLRSLWGLGDGSTTFNVPDLRGAFERAWDDSRGLDADRAIASFQLDALQGHRHSLIVNINNGFSIGGNSLAGTGAGANVSDSRFTGYTVSDGLFGSARSAAETRPINYALLPVIKY